MSKVITVNYRGGRKNAVGFSPDKEFGKAMNLVAESFKTYECEPDFIIINSATIFDICISSQSFFEDDLKLALENVGIVDVKASGWAGGSHEYVIELIKKVGDGFIEHIDYDFSAGAKCCVLYQIEKQ